MLRFMLRRLGILKQIIAILLVLLNINITFKIIQREIKWHRAYNRLWPVLLHKRTLNSEIPSLKHMIELEASDVELAKNSEYSKVFNRNGSLSSILKIEIHVM